MGDRDLELMAHLMRRAGFGATRDELERYLAQGYEATVDELLSPGDDQSMPDDLIRRYHTDQAEARMLPSAGATWIYRMVTTRSPLDEKVALFWHGLFATGYTKLNQARTLLNQVDMFRRCGLEKFPALLVELSQDPAMIIWLDNQDNHKDAINENYGRELLELFSMGIGNYTEQDIKECSRAFTGWTLKNAEFMAMRASKDSIWPYGRIAWHFEYRADDHDHGEKTFLGEAGNFNGQDIIEIIVRQEATAEFVCRRLFQYFASDEVDGEGRETIQGMKDTYFDSGYEIRSVLRTLFNSDYFKSHRARYSRVKGPVELMVGAIRMAGSYQTPTFGAQTLAAQALYMGQGLLQPPTVEGWHEGMEWIDSGSLVERVNFAARQLGDVQNPGVRSIIARLAREGEGVLTAEQLVGRCLDLMGPISVSEGTASSLVALAERDGDLDLKEHHPGDDAERRVGNMLRLIASTKEYQLA